MEGSPQIGIELFCVIPFISHAYHDGSGFFQDEDGPSLTGHSGPLNGFMSMKMTQSICHCLHDHLMREYLERKILPPFNKILHFDSVWWPSTLRRLLLLIYPLICHPSVYAHAKTQIVCFCIPCKPCRK